MAHEFNEQSIQKLDIVPFLTAILRHWWAILLLGLSLALLSDSVAHFRYHARYQSQSVFVVTNKERSNDISRSLSSAQSTAKLFSSIIESDALQKAVAADLGLEEFPAVARASVLQSTNLMTLTVTADTPMLAYRSIRSIMDNYSQVTDYVMENINLEVLQAPAIPKAPSASVNDRRTMFLGFAAGILIGILWFGLMNAMNDTVKKESDISDKIAARHLGTIYRDKQGSKKHAAGTGGSRKVSNLLITNPLLSFRYAESTRMTAMRVQNQLDRRKAKTLLVTSVGEHEGKSTVAANIALALAETGKKVLLVDCDFRKPTLYLYFNMTKDDAVNLPEILRDHKDFSNMIRTVEPSGLYLIANKTPSFNVDEYLNNGVFEYILDFSRKQMDYVIVDSSPMALVSDTVDLAQLSDASLLVIRQDTVLARDINDSIDTLNATKGSVIGVVLNDASGIHAGSTDKYGYGGHYGYGYGGHGSYGGSKGGHYGK